MEVEHLKEILTDIETYGEVDLNKCGLYRYASDDSFEILLVAWTVNEGHGFGETQLADLASGDPFPEELLSAFLDPDATLIAHNAAFERVCFSYYLQRNCPGLYLREGEFLTPDQWKCTMVMGASLTLPFSLRDAAAVLKTAEQKDKEGERLIKLFSTPCKPTKSNGGRKRNLPEHYPDDWEKFKGYCVQDVKAELAIYRRLSRFPMLRQEWRHYHTDQRINDRGVKIDTELVQQAIACDLMLSDAMAKKAYELTGLENPNSVPQLKTWLEERGIPMESLGKKDVAVMIEELDKNGVDEEALSMLKLRLQMAKSSVKKYQAAERCVCGDGRARGLFQFYGASRTGRYCLAEGTPVLVKDSNGKIYEKPIEDVRTEDLVFDGENWVRHEGVVFSGDKEVITWDGITATKEHKVFIDETTKVTLEEAMERGLLIWRGKNSVFTGS